MTDRTIKEQARGTLHEDPDVVRLLAQGYTLKDALILAHAQRGGRERTAWRVAP